MKRTVVVTAVGGGVGQSVLKCLGGADCRTIGVDIHDTAAGLYQADEGFLNHPANDPRFVDGLLDICRETKADYLFPGMDAELPYLAERRDEFLALGTTPVVSDPEVIRFSDNKLALCRHLARLGMTHIPTATSIEAARHLKPPYIIKPATGCRSQGVRKVESLDGQVLEPGEIVQEFIEGDEYTCGSVGFDGRVLGVIAMRRELRAGDTYKAVVDQHPAVVRFVGDLVREIRPFGPCNVQCRVRDGQVFVLEINARCSGTTAARMHAGFNEPRMTIDHLEGREATCRIEPVEICRYWNEVVVRPGDKSRIRSTERL